jgi:hypothetical protein
VLAFYDDAENLYHAFALARGQIPYLDDFNHHFEGFVAEYLIGGLLLGFSPMLIRACALFNQTAMAYGVFLCAAEILPRRFAVLAAVFAISAREPWVLGFYPQYQINLVLVYVVWSALRALRGNETCWICFSSFLCGILLTFDQRTALAPIIPAAAMFLTRQGGSPRRWTASLAACLAAPAAALVWLYFHGALGGFIEQTVIFPLRFRSAGNAGIFAKAIELHRYLPELTPHLVAGGLIGVAALARKFSASGAVKLFFASAVPIAVMPLVGGRDFDYYTLPWIPWLAIAAAASPEFFKGEFVRRAWLVLLWSAPVISLLAAAHFLATPDAGPRNEGDGTREVEAFLRGDLASSDSLFIWGYRLEPYIALQRTSAYPFANTILIHPDSSIKDPAKRALHVYPKYEALFERLLTERPPQVVVTFTREGSEDDSPAQRVLYKTLAQRYRREFSVEKRDFKGALCTYVVYRLRDSKSG